MAPSARNFDVESGAQQRTLKVERQFFALGLVLAVTCVVSAMVGAAVGPMLIGSDHRLDHSTAFKLDKAIVKAFHVSAPVGLPRVQARSDVRMQSAVVADVMEALKGMTLLEASELVKAIEETFDVDASAGGGGMMMMAPGAAAGGGGEAAAAEEKTDFDVSLESFPADKKIAVLKIVRSVSDLGLKEAKEFVESAPKVLKEGVKKEEAEDIKKQLEEVGAVVTVK